MLINSLMVVCSKDGKSSCDSAVCVADIDYLDINISLCEPEVEPNRDKKVLLLSRRFRNVFGLDLSGIQ